MKAKITPANTAQTTAKIMRIMRKGAGLSQVQLAEKMGLNHNRVAQLESGKQKRGGTLLTLAQIASACGLHVEVTITPKRRMVKK